jgi:hypothetical protein
MKCDLLESVKKRFAAEGIAPPYSQRAKLYPASGKKRLDK